MGLRIPSINRHNHTAKKIEQYEESLAVGEELEIVCYTQEGSDIKYFIDDKEVDEVSTLDLVWAHPIDIWLTITDLCAETSNSATYKHSTAEDLLWNVWTEVSRFLNLLFCRRMEPTSQTTRRLFSRRNCGKQRLRRQVTECTDARVSITTIKLETQPLHSTFSVSS